MIGVVIKKVAIENVELIVANIMGLAKSLIKLLGAKINIDDSIVKYCKSKGV